MRKSILISCALVFLLAQAHAYIPLNEIEGASVLLNGTDWKFKLNVSDIDFYLPEYDDSDWDQITVPSNWEMAGFEEPMYGKNISESTGYYRRNFEVTKEWKGKSVFIRFDGVYSGYELWVNGKPIASYESSFNRSEFEIGEHLNFDSNNTLVVKVYKRFRGFEFDTHDAWSLSGIYRDVTLFAVNKLHISDYTVVTDLDNEFVNATLRCNFEIGYNPATSRKREFEITGILKDVENHIVARFSKEGSVSNRATISIDTEIQHPELWNAETPHLYSLEITLKEKEKILHTINQQIGFREIHVENGVLKLNGKKITIKGVNRHDIYPTVGRAINREIMVTDLTLMKQGNINTIRLSHYPPHPLFIKLCNEYGIYLIDEVPFGFGDKHLTDTSYQDILYQRAEATVARDKNDPSVVIWSVGNENELTPLVANTAKRVKELDPTRMIILPGSGMEEEYPDAVDLLAPHYPFFAPVYYSRYPKKANVLSEFGMSDLGGRPYIVTEFNHSLGGSFEGLARRWNVMKNHDHISGGCIWMWNNQGIIRKVNGQKTFDTPEEMFVSANNPSEIVVSQWIDNETVIDSRGTSGTDGIVDAFRVPLADYWITREVFSPVLFLEKELKIGPGKQLIPLHIENTYDFTDLSEATVKFELIVDGKKVHRGELDLSQKPGTIKKYFQKVDAPDSLHNQVMFLTYKVYDSRSRHISDHSIKLIPEYLDVDLSKNFSTRGNKTIQQSNGDLIQELYTYHKNQEAVLLNNTDADQLFSTVPLLRVGRQAEMAEIRNYTEKTGREYWTEYLLDDPKQENRTWEKRSNGYVMKDVSTYSRKGKENESIEAVLEYEFNNQGWIDISYKLIPSNVSGYFLELGLGLLLPAGMDQLKWVGDGPYSAWFDQDDASKYGIHQQSPDSMYYKGNKQNVELALVSDEKGNGVCVLSDKNTISLEQTEEGIVFSHILLSAGKGNKTSYQISLKTYKASEIESVKGDFRIYPVDGNHWPQFLQNLFVKN